MSEVQAEREKSTESDSDEDTESETGGDESAESPSEDNGQGARLSMLLREIRRIELGSPVGRASVYPGMFITAMVALGGIQFEYAPSVVSLNTSVGVGSIGLLLLYFLLDVTVAYYFVPRDVYQRR